MGYKDGHNSDDAKIDGAEEGDLVEHLLDELAGGLARTEAGNVAAVLLQVIGHLNRIELDGGIEISEEDDQQEVNDGIGNGGGTEVLGYPAVGVSGKRGDGGGDGGDGLRKDDGHNAGHVHLHGQVGALAAVHLAAHDPLRVLDGNAALSIIGEDNEVMKVFVYSVLNREIM